MKEPPRKWWQTQDMSAIDFAPKRTIKGKDVAIALAIAIAWWILAAIFMLAGGN